MNIPVPHFLLPRHVRDDLYRRADLTGTSQRTLTFDLPFGFRLIWTVACEKKEHGNGQARSGHD